MMSRWKSMIIMRQWWFGDESVKIGDASMMSRWLIGDKSMIMMRQWWVGDESLNIDDHDVSMMSRWGIGNESGDELVIINDESVISRWKSMMRRLVGAESVMSRCLFRNSRISRYQGRIFPLTYYLNLPSPVTSTRTSVRLFFFKLWDRPVRD